MPLVNFKVVEGAQQGKGLPESFALPLVVTDAGVTEADGTKLQEFLTDVKNALITVIVSPLPDDKQVESNPRFGKNTLKTVDGKTEGQDNSEKIVSQQNVYARISQKLPFADQDGTRWVLKGSIFSRTTFDADAAKAAGVADEDEE